MKSLSVLVVDNDPGWADLISDSVVDIDHNANILKIGSYEEAAPLILSKQFDLAVFDIALLGDSDERGLDLANKLFNSPKNIYCALIVITSFPTTARVKRALREIGAYDLVEKSRFNGNAFRVTLRSAILDARLRAAVARADNRFTLTVTLNKDCVLSSDLIGPGAKVVHVVNEQFDAKKLAHLTDELNIHIVDGEFEKWRENAKQIGRSLYNTLSEMKPLYSDIVSGRNLAQNASSFWMQFSGPAEGLSLPFELMRDEDTYHVIEHVVTRRLARHSSQVSRKTESFRQFITNLPKCQQVLNCLVIGANSDYTIPDTEQEAELIAESLKSNLELLGIPHDVNLLMGQDAHLTPVLSELQSKRYHLLHYAGHGVFSDEFPESSGIVLRDSNKLITLTTDQLNSFFSESHLQLAFLSCCLSARHSDQVGRGDFYGTMEAIARADVPCVVGYRWVVGDKSALQLARHFYDILWTEFSPGTALYYARRKIVEEFSRDNETWASPVLLMQNP